MSAVLQANAGKWGAPDEPPVVPSKKPVRAKLNTIGDVRHQLGRCYRSALNGTMRTEDASRLANILQILSRLIVDSDLEARLAALEAQQGASR